MGVRGGPGGPGDQAGKGPAPGLGGKRGPPRKRCHQRKVLAPNEGKHIERRRDPETKKTKVRRSPIFLRPPPTNAFPSKIPKFSGKFQIFLRIFRKISGLKFGNGRGNFLAPPVQFFPPGPDFWPPRGIFGPPGIWPDPPRDRIFWGSRGVPARSGGSQILAPPGGSKKGGPDTTKNG